LKARELQQGRAGKKARGRFLGRRAFFNSSDGGVMPVICPTRQIIFAALVKARRAGASCLPHNRRDAAASVFFSPASSSLFAPSTGRRRSQGNLQGPSVLFMAEFPCLPNELAKYFRRAVQ
jgi:hypothetical protein